MTTLVSTLVLGGARSGKSVFGEKLVADSALSRIYLATATRSNDEMTQRIAHHRSRRGDGWTTVEEPLALVDALTREAGRGRAVLVDCLTLWVTNLMLDNSDIPAECARLVDLVSRLKGRVVFVSNEVGLGIVPENRMARDFRDHAGRLHQSVAAHCAEVYFIAAGLPLKMKG